MEKIRFKLEGIIFLIVGINIILFTNYMYIAKENEDAKKVEIFLSSENDTFESESYVGVLEIPKINLKRGFYNLDSVENTVDKNIEMIDTSKMPNVLNSNLILASHSGNSNISHFKKLDILSINDIAYIYYNDIKYEYKLINIYSEVKDGIISIRRNVNETNLTLITCDKKNKTLQNVYIFKLMV